MNVTSTGVPTTTRTVDNQKEKSVTLSQDMTLPSVSTVTRLYQGAVILLTLYRRTNHYNPTKNAEDYCTIRIISFSVSIVLMNLKKIVFH